MADLSGSTPSSEEMARRAADEAEGRARVAVALYINGLITRGEMLGRLQRAGLRAIVASSRGWDWLDDYHEPEPMRGGVIDRAIDSLAELLLGVARLAADQGDTAERVDAMQDDLARHLHDRLDIAVDMVRAVRQVTG